MKQILFALCLLPFLTFGQKARIEFRETSHYFGTVYEAAGKVSYDFIYTNTGQRPLILTKLHSGCGCTVTEWSRKPVLPGQSGRIKVTFDPTRRPGSFIKSIAVNSNASNSTVSLTIRGTVDSRPLSPYDAYGYRLGDLRFRENSLHFGDQPETRVKDRKLHIVNSGNQPLHLSVRSDHKGFCVLEYPEHLGKGEKGYILVQLNPQKAADWGYIKGRLEIEVDGKKRAGVELTANIKEDFSATDKATAPAIRLSEQGKVLEELVPNTTYIHTFFIQNTGKSELVIRKITPSDPGISAQVSKTRIKPGKKAKVNVTFRTGTDREETRLLQIISNTPATPSLTYTLTGILQK